MLLLETLLLAVFLVLDILLFYIFFESILPPLFILIGLFGSSNKVRASFYLFLYTLLGSLFLLLSILTISSNGIGIRPEMLEAVFTPFAQDDTTLARSAGGLGIGLSIARAVAELHGGSLIARSDGLNKGAVFEAAIPLSTLPAAAARTHPTSASTERRRRILLVEDNADIRESLRMVLDLLGPRGHAGRDRRRRTGDGPAGKARRRAHRHRPARDERLRGGARNPCPQPATAARDADDRHDRLRPARGPRAGGERRFRRPSPETRRSCHPEKPGERLARALRAAARETAARAPAG